MNSKWINYTYFRNIKKTKSEALEQVLRIFKEYDKTVLPMAFMNSKKELMNKLKEHGYDCEHYFSSLSDTWFVEKRRCEHECR